MRWQLDALSAASLLSVAAIVGSVPTVVAAFLVGVEVAFGVICALKYRSYSPPRISKTEPISVIEKLLDPQDGLTHLIQPGEYLSHWFKGAHAHEIEAEAVEDFLAHSVGIHKGLHSELIAKVKGSDAFIRILRFFTTHLPASNNNAQNAEESRPVGSAAGGEYPFMAPMDEPLTCSYRPFLFYLCMEILASITRIKLVRAGFKLHVTEHAVYFCKDGKSSAGAEKSQTQTPIVFLHGIGVGLFPYLKFLNGLSDTGRPVIAVHYRHVSMRLTASFPSPLQIAADISSFLQMKQTIPAVVVAHSYGTLIASALNRHHASQISSLTLIDPVCLAMFMPNMLQNTLYFSSKKQPFRLQNLLKGLVIKDIHCSVALCRTFHWHDVNMWRSELPPNALVVLSGQDDLVPVNPILRMLAEPSSVHATATSPRVMLHHGLAHGGFLTEKAWQQQIISNMNDYALAPSSTVWPLAPPPVSQSLTPAPADLTKLASVTVLTAVSKASLRGAASTKLVSAMAHVFGRTGDLVRRATQHVSLSRPVVRVRRTVECRFRMRPKAF